MNDQSPSSPDGQPPPRQGGAEGALHRGGPGVAALRPLVAAALDGISEGFLILDRDWRFVFVNPAAERLVQRSRAELLGRSLWEIFPEAGDRRFGIEYRWAVTENVPVHFEDFYPAPLDAWYEVRAYPSPEGLSIFFRDVTERHTVDEALRQSEERYRSLFSRMSQGFALFEVNYDEHGVPVEACFLDVNPAFERMTGLTRGEVIGRRGRDVFPADYAQWARVYERVVQTGAPITVSHAASATDRHYEVFAFQPAARQFAVLFHDITDHKRLEQELRVNLTKYSVLFDAMPLGISVTDAEGNVREINQIASRVLGTRPEAVVGQRIGRPEWRIIRPDGSPMPPEEFASVRCLKEQRAVEDVEAGIARPGEDVLWISASAAPLPLEGYGVVITYADVSRRRQAEAALVEAHRGAVDARARLEAVMDALPTGVAIVDAEGGVSRSNATYEQIWGTSRPATRSVSDDRPYTARWIDTGREVLPEEWASARAVRHGETVIGQALEIERFDGGRTYVLNSAAPTLDESGTVTGCAVAVQDITARVEVEHALERSQDELQRTNCELNAANEALRRNNETLEARVAGRTADLARRTAQLRALTLDLTRAEDRERRRVAQVIHDSLQQLLSVARINLGMVTERADAKPFRTSLLEVDGLLADSLKVTRSLTAELSPAILHRSGLAASLRWLGRWFQERFGLTVAVDAEAEMTLDEETRVTLFRAARELLFNVVKHARTSSARISLGRTADGRAQVVVSDQGVGFDPETLREWDGTGDGFGLFSLRERVDILGGQFEVMSERGRGTTFAVSGPPPRPVTPKAKDAKSAASRKAMGRSRRATQPGRPARPRKPRR